MTDRSMYYGQQRQQDQDQDQDQVPPQQQQSQPQPPQQQYPPQGAYQQPQYPQQQYSQPQYQQQQYPQQPAHYGQPPFQQAPPSHQAPTVVLPPQPEPAAKPRRKRGFWFIVLVVILSPFIGIAYFLMGLYWVFLWLMTPVALVVHFLLCALGLIWYTPVKLLASGRSRHRILQPRYPGFPPFWSARYWVRLRGRVKDTCEFAVGIASIFSP